MTIGGGSSELKAKSEISPLQGLKERYKNATILHALGYATGPSAYGRVVASGLDAGKLQQEAIEAASKADIVLFFGGLNKNHFQDCEGADRQSYELPFGQNELLKNILQVNNNVGVVLISGKGTDPYIMEAKGQKTPWSDYDVAREELLKIK